jgi:primosomal protein N'
MKFRAMEQTALKHPDLLAPNGAQMLIENPSRTALQRFLAAWQAVLHSTRQRPEGRGLIRWAIDVDPLLI